ncbi:MAG: hypothetical protein JRI23_27310 [Deltaproteobacteria bacterium]|jgi:hypothetical protein|nr:hypothetical protein [Deltaproteobacteria bacterium]MBW2535788.1 hypothetical protein [Deltaproteobacteria bacterium]
MRVGFRWLLDAAVLALPFAGMAPATLGCGTDADDVVNSPLPIGGSGGAVGGSGGAAGAAGQPQGGGTVGGGQPDGGTLGLTRPFDDTSPYNTEIPANPVLDPNSSRATMVNAARPTMALYLWTPRIYEVDGDTEQRILVSCTEAWGTCELEDSTQNQAGGVPIPAGALGAPEADGHMVVWDRKNEISYDFWRYRYPNNTAPEGQTSWGGLVSTAGNGVDTPGGRFGAGGATGADIARLAGIIRVAEVQSGVIPHALVGPTTNSCSTFRWPALKSDGWSTRSDCLPEGARMQLDPSIDLDTVTGLRPIDRMVAEALQTYGWFNIDNGGSFNGSETGWAVQFESDLTATGTSCPAVGQTYCAAGAAAEYDALRGTLPDSTPLFSHMRVLNTWNGQ